jgi:outer membrane protein assembly factor BamB
MSNLVRIMAIFLALMTALMLPVHLPSQVHGSNPSALTGNLSQDEQALVVLPDGYAYWYTAAAGTYRYAMNLTIALTEHYGLSLNYSMSSYGAFVNEIGGYWNNNSSTGPDWFLFIWNYSIDTWSVSNYGASSLNLSQYPVFAWYYTSYNPTTFAPDSLPAETPLSPFAITSFRGPSGNGYIPYYSNTGLSGVSNHLSWVAHTGVGGIDTQPVVANGTVYFLTDGNASGSYLEAYNYFGVELWSTVIPGDSYQLSSPLIVNNELIVTSTNGMVYAVNASTGKIEFQFRASQSITSSPELTTDGFLILNGTGGLLLYSFNGTLIWKLNLGGSEYYTSPVFDGRVIIAASVYSNESRVYAVTSNGSLQWNYTVPGKIKDTPSVYGNTVYFISSSTVNTMYALSLNGALEWKFDAGASSSAPSSPTPSPYGLFFISGTTLFALNQSTGTELWSMNVSNSFAGPSPEVFGRYLIVSTNSANSSLYVIYPNGTVLWKYTVSESNDYSLSSPVFNGTSIFWGDDDGNFYAFQPLRVIDFTYTQLNGTATFSATHISAIKNVSFEWVMGNITHSGTTFVYNFTRNGNYTVTLMARYSNNTTAYFSQTVSINSVPAHKVVSHPSQFNAALYAILAVIVIVVIAVAIIALRKRRSR